MDKENIHFKEVKDFKENNAGTTTNNNTITNFYSPKNLLSEVSKQNNFNNFNNFFEERNAINKDDENNDIIQDPFSSLGKFVYILKLISVS